MNKLDITGTFTLKKDTFYILIVTKGEGLFKSGDETLKVKFGDKFLIPAASESVEIIAESSLELILALPAEYNKVSKSI